MTDLGVVAITACATAVGVADDELTLTSALAEFPSWDSLAVLELLTILEDGQGVVLEPVELFECATPGDVAVLLERALRALPR